jgi:hypothetical protein
MNRLRLITRFNWLNRLNLLIRINCSELSGPYPGWHACYSQ